jgi:hypothetical protein
VITDIQKENNTTFPTDAKLRKKIIDNAGAEKTLRKRI